MELLPNYTDRKRKPCRKFVVTILATMEPDFVKSAVLHAHAQSED